MNLGIVIISLAASYLIVAWLNVFIKKIKRSHLIKLIMDAEDVIELSKLMSKIVPVSKSLHNQGESAIEKLSFLAEKSKCDYIISRVKNIREEHSKLKVGE